MENQSFIQTHTKDKPPEIEDDYSGFVIIRLAPAYEGLIVTDLEEVGDLVEVNELLGQYGSPQRLIDPELIRPELLLNIERRYFPGIPPPRGLSDREERENPDPDTKYVSLKDWQRRPEFSTDINLRRNILAQWGWNRHGLTLPHQKIFAGAMAVLGDLADKYDVRNSFILPMELAERGEGGRLTQDDLDTYEQAIQQLNDLNEIYQIPPKLSAPTAMRQYRQILQQAIDRPFRDDNYYSLTSYWRVDMRQISLLERRALVEALNTLEEIGLAYEELATTLPLGGAVADDQAPPPYLGEDGLHVDDLWPAPAQITEGDHQVNFGDVELGWGLTDGQGNQLAAVDTQLVAGNHPSNGIQAHGTAVLGIILGEVDGPKGVATHIVNQAYAATCYQCDANNVCSQNNIAQAIALLVVGTPNIPADADNILPDAGYLHSGDVLLLEVQRSLYPTEIDDADFNAIQLAVARGVIVIEAAGNRGYNLNNYTRYSVQEEGFIYPFARDSGAVLVGAVNNERVNSDVPVQAHLNALFNNGTGDFRNDNVHWVRATSNRGERIDCYAWGGGVATTGNPVFAGTSAAAAQIAGAALLLQAHHRAAHNGNSLTPGMMRNLLTTLDLPPVLLVQNTGLYADIGIVPDLAGIVANLP